MLIPIVADIQFHLQDSLAGIPGLVLNQGHGYLMELRTRPYRLPAKKRRKMPIATKWLHF